MEKTAVTVKKDPDSKGFNGIKGPAGSKGIVRTDGTGGSDRSGGSVGSDGSIKRKFLIFSVILFLAVLVGGSVAFIVSMRQIVHAAKSNELRQSLEIERITLEASVNAEIAIAMKMADSPLIKRYFQDPGNPDLEAIAFEEIAAYRRAFASNSLFWINDVDKRFYSDDAFAYTLDPNDPAQYWYLMTLNETEEYNFNINYNPDLNVTNLWINAPVFADDGKPIGVLGTGILLTTFIDSIYSGYSGGAELYFFNADGEITGAKDSKLVADKVSVDAALGAAGAEILARVKSGSVNAIQTFTGGAGEIALGPVPALGWYAVAIQPLTLGDYLNSGMTVLFVVMMLLVLVIFIIFNLFIRTFVRPLSGMIAALNQISGDWNLTRRLDAGSNDEIGNLAGFFNQTFEKFRELLGGIKNKAFSLADTGEELSANMDGTSAAIEKINTVMQGIRGQVLNQADEVNKSAGSVERIIEGLEKLNAHIAVQSESVAQSSSAIEEMLASIQSVTDTLVRNTRNISSLAESSGVGRADLQKVAADIQEIARDSEGLLEINSVMQNIASQTNLLAMNAAIEAAHAGDSGRGFAVVADEIRKLAENSGGQSKTISTVLKKIKTAIDMITKSTAIVLERFETIEREVETVSSQETQIRSAMEEQGVGSRNILDAVTRLNEVTGLVQRASADMTSETRDALNESASLKNITAEVAGSMDEMAESADQITSAVTRAKEISIENKENINSLSAEIARFKVEK